MKHPMQPISLDKEGIPRFQENAIVRFLLNFCNNKGVGLREIDLMPFSNEDRTQLAQLIGYSIGGYGELDYVSDEYYTQANKIAESLKQKAVVAEIEKTLNENPSC